MSIEIGSVVAWESSIGKIEGVVRKIVQRGKVPGIAIDISGTKSNPAFQIEVLKENGSAILVGKHHSDLHIVSENKSSKIASLTQKQIDKLNSFRGNGLPEIDFNTLIVVDFVVADNLINRGKGKWVSKDLNSLAKMLDTMGIPHTLDHDWENINKARGIVIEGKVVKENAAPDNLIKAAGNQEENTKIVAKEGFVRVVASTVFRVDDPLVSLLSMGIGRAVSLGGFSFKDYVCPICEVSFAHKNCPHYIPNSWESWGEDPSEIAPYYIRDGVYDLGELSSVLIANLPGAQAVCLG